MSRDTMIRIFLQDNGPGRSGVSVEINNEATIQNLISAYCAKKGIGYNSTMVILDPKRNSLPHFRTLQSLGINDGQTLFVGYEKKSTSMDKRWIFILTVIIMSVFILAIILMASFYATSGGPTPFDYGVVMDGGSSKTNVILYKWAGDKHRGTGCVREEASKKAEGGIAKQENVSYVLPALDYVTGFIKPSSISTTPLYFASTAGMRLLSISDPNKVENILNELEVMLNNTGLSLQKVQIISGKDEGKYDWITANFLKDTLEKESKQNPWRPTTVGALDMGGASAQIAFALDPKTNASDHSVEIIELYGQKHHVFSSSSLCFGRDEAERRHRALLVQDPNQIKNIVDPCTPRDYTYSVPGHTLFGGVCTKTPKFDDWLKNNPGLQDENVTFMGSGDYQRCSDAMKSLVDENICTTNGFKNCFKEIEQPVDNHHFLAFATYFYTTLGLNLTTSSFDEFLNGAKGYCSRTVDQVNVKIKFATDYCFNACYMYEILVAGYGFSNETWSKIEFLGKIDDKEISWPIGYMIKATNIIPAKKPLPKFTSIGAFAVSMIIFIVIVIAAAAFLAYNFGTKSADQYSLQRA